MIKLQKIPKDLFLSDEIDTIFSTSNPKLVILMGLPASGKSTIAKSLQDKFNFILYRTDLIRKENVSQEKLFSKHSLLDRTKIYDLMFSNALEDIKSKNILKYKGIIFDATFIKSKFREKIACLANDYNLDLIIIHTQCDEATAIERIKIRTKENYESNALEPRVYYENKDMFEKLDISKLERKFTNLTIKYLKFNTSI